MCADSKEALTIYEPKSGDERDELNISIVPCGWFDTSKTNCAPPEVFSEFLKTTLYITWFIPSRKYNSNGYGKDMMSNQMTINEFTMDIGQAYHRFHIREFSVKSEESWDGLEFFDAVED